MSFHNKMEAVMLDEVLLGLSSVEAKERQKIFGKNLIIEEEKVSFLNKLLHIIKEPMFLLLIVATIVYFVLGEPIDGLMMLVFVAVIISIEAIQEWRTDQTLKALRDLSAPKSIVIRDGIEQTINSFDLVPGDVILIAEGMKIPADGKILKYSTLCVDESLLTGEAEPIWKETENNINDSENHWRKDYCYAGTLVTQGTGIILIDKIGQDTEYGKIGKNIMISHEEKSPLQV